MRPRPDYPALEYVAAAVLLLEAPALVRCESLQQLMPQLQEGAHVSRIDAAVLTAVNLADELLKAQEAAENLRRQLKTYLDEASQAKAEASELKRQLFKAQQGHK